MRSRPATRTAFACVNLTAAPARARLPASKGEPTLSDGGASTLESAVASSSRLPVAVPPCETVSEEAATPGCPQRFHVWEPLGNSSFRQRQAQTFRLTISALSRRLPQNRPCAITGGVSLTPAVIALSLIVTISSTEISAPAVRKLWTTKLACGS